MGLAFSFVFRGHNVDVPTIGEHLGVRYLVEGSVRRGGQRLRLTVQLIEAATGNHLWADRYDGSLEDVFEFLLSQLAYPEMKRAGGGRSSTSPRWRRSWGGGALDPLRAS